MNPAFTPLRQHLLRFHPFTDDDFNLIEPHLEEKELKRGQNFAEEGRLAKSVGFVLSGDLRHYYTQNGLERTTYFYFENHLVCSYISCISGKPSLITIEALTDCKLIQFPYSAVNSLYAQSLAWATFGRKLAEYLAMGLEDRMVTLLTLTPEQRYHHLLNSNKGKITDRIPQQFIANYLGITPVSLSRIRNRAAKK